MPLSSALIEAVYEPAVQPQLWKKTIRTVADELGVGAAIIPLSVGTPAWRFGSHPDGTADRLYYEHWWRHCPMRQLMPKHETSNVLFLDDSFLSDAELARHPYYQEFLRSFGVARRHYAILNLGPGQSLCFATQRPLGAPPETPEQARDRRLLSSHVRRSLAISLTFEQQRQALDTFEMIFMRLKQGAALLDRQGRVLVANPALERLSGDGIVLSGRHLSASIEQEKPALDRLLRVAKQTDWPAANTSVLRLSRPSGSTPLLVHVLPAASAGEAVDAISDRAAALVLVGSAEDTDTLLGPILENLGLSRAEARLAERVGRGSSPGHVADQLGISVGNARQTLKSVFSKLDVHSQSQLVQLVQTINVTCI